MKGKFFLRALIALFVAYSALAVLLLVLVKKGFIEGFQAFTLYMVVSVVVYFGTMALVALQK